jgi:hypothetical protein
MVVRSTLARLWPAATGLVLALVGAALVLASQPFKVRSAAYRSAPRFTVSDAGSGSWSTTYHSEPPDGGGKHDTDTADDSSTQSWALTFSHRLPVARCRSRCRRIVELGGATGHSSATGQIDHVHIDGLADNYFTPGFSFAEEWGPARWFTSSTVTVPLSVLHRAARITIPLADTPAGRPPRDCAVPYPSWQRCRTGGAWAGTLTLKRSG